jgi:glycosyltransferase involved in cell wall biosynthesis
LGWTAVLAQSPLVRHDVSTEPCREESLLSVAHPITEPPLVARPSSGRRFGMLGTFPPIACGVATFSAALADGLAAGGATVDVVRVGDGPPSSDPRVIQQLEAGSPDSLLAATRALSSFDVAIVQHEYGLYGGSDGDEVVTLIEGLDVPCIVVAHTVLLSPTPHQRAVLEGVAAAASFVVVMTEAGRDRLCTGYAVDPEKIVVIPHGAATVTPRGRVGHLTRPTLLTWGLLGPGKGIEWAIDALSLLKDLRPRPHYVIAGDTHPKVLAADGEAYRDMLVRRSWEQGVSPMVSFDSGYRDLASLSKLIDTATVVVLPYDSRDQVTSGVLVDAVAAGCPVVATAFPHAVELLDTGAGVVVPQRDPEALAAALRQVLTEDGLATSMAEEAMRLAPGLRWPAVAAQYRVLAEELTGAYDGALA